MKVRLGLVLVVVGLAASATVGGYAHAAGGGVTPSPQVLYGGGFGGGFTCSVKANNPHTSTTQATYGWASADGYTDCTTNVDEILNQTALYRYGGGGWNAVGDRDFTPSVLYGANHVTSTSKQTGGCTSGAVYMDKSYGYAVWSGYVVLNGTETNDNYGSGYRIC
jgi:hypothetical protein